MSRRWTDLPCAAPDLATGGAVLTVIEDIKAGDLPRKTVASGQCVRIMTGAPIPPGADAVIRVEDTRMLTDDCVETTVPVKAGNDIRVRGETCATATSCCTRERRSRAWSASLATIKRATSTSPACAVSCSATVDAGLVWKYRLGSTRRSRTAMRWWRRRERSAWKRSSRHRRDDAGDLNAASGVGTTTTCRWNKRFLDRMLYMTTCCGNA